MVPKINIEKLIRIALPQSSFSIFSSVTNPHAYKCLVSTIDQYEENLLYDFYQIKPLLRLLGKKMGLFTTELYEEIQEDDQTLSIIIDWSRESKAVLLLCHNHSIELYNQSTLESLQRLRPQLKEWINQRSELKESR